MSNRVVPLPLDIRHVPPSMLANIALGRRLSRLGGFSLRLLPRLALLTLFAFEVVPRYFLDASGSELNAFAAAEAHPGDGERI